MVGQRHRSVRVVFTPWAFSPHARIGMRASSHRTQSRIATPLSRAMPAISFFIHTVGVVTHLQALLPKHVLRHPPLREINVS
jgi:hypothetical protein